MDAIYSILLVSTLIAAITITTTAPSTALFLSCTLTLLGRHIRLQSLFPLSLLLRY